jgi:hypothetical protein
MDKKQTKTAREHAKIETLEMFGQKIRMGPVSLIVYAKDFLAAAKAVPDGRFTPAPEHSWCAAHWS